MVVARLCCVLAPKGGDEPEVNWRSVSIMRRGAVGRKHAFAAVSETTGNRWQKAELSTVSVDGEGLGAENMIRFWRRLTASV
jgi:hypothetical protein